MPELTFDPVPLLTQELNLPPTGISAVLRLLGEGGTVPFIARYRKEATGGLDEVQIRTIAERQGYLKELNERQHTILKSIDEQGKLTDALRARILACTTKTTLEDLYLPYKPKRRTRALIAREKGLEPLAQRIAAQPESGQPLQEAQAFVDPEKGVSDVDEALKGARDIVAEQVAENADVRALIRRRFERDGRICSKKSIRFKEPRSKFEQYYDFDEAVATIPSHRFLAIRRGEREKVLSCSLSIDRPRVQPRVLELAGYRPGSPFAAHMEQACDDALQRLLEPSVETDVRVELKMRSDRDAIEIFADNIKSLLLAAPLGAQPVMGIDPGLRTGCKTVAVDATGRFLATTVLHLSKGDAAKERARLELIDYVKRFAPVAIAVGNGTGGRETEAFVRMCLKDASLGEVMVVSVNESGASVYSASDLAREEFPDLDLTVRGAISIARRLQDPLAELVKVEPKAIGVGQYQHDVNQPLLGKKLNEVVESCVNAVGVDLNTTSAALLSRVAGIGSSQAKKIIVHRDQHGAFANRRALLKVPGLGPRAFEQAAGFLRIRGGDTPLDASAVHPERYALVERMAGDLGVKLGELVGKSQQVQRIDIARYVGGDVGEPTLRDIIAELQKPGRDPRAHFEPPKFRDDVHELGDLKLGMQFEGVVTNVTAFGAFVDIGVHQDGLVHISKLANRFVRDPREVVKAGDRIQVKVIDLDLERKRISLSARSDDAPERAPRGQRPQHGRPGPRSRGAQVEPEIPHGDGKGFSNNPFAAAFKSSNGS